MSKTVVPLLGLIALFGGAIFVGNAARNNGVLPPLASAEAASSTAVQPIQVAESNRGLSEWQKIDYLVGQSRKWSRAEKEQFAFDAQRVIFYNDRCNQLDSSDVEFSKLAVQAIPEQAAKEKVYLENLEQTFGRKFVCDGMQRALHDLEISRENAETTANNAAVNTEAVKTMRRDQQFFDLGTAGIAKSYMKPPSP